GPGGAQMPASVSYNNEERKATLNPSVTLDPGATYTAHLTTGIRADDETALAATVNWSFTTIPPAPPAVTQTSPGAGASQLGGYTDVTATFDQAMSAASIDEASFTLEGPDGEPVAASVSYDALTRTATLTPNADLDANTIYTATMTDGVTSANGLTL